MVSFSTELHEPDNSTIVAVSLSAFGGKLPYKFTAEWSDDLVQSSSAPAFPRTFLSNQTIPRTVNVTVTSSDGQSAGIVVSINATTSN